MKKLRRMGATLIVSLALAISVSAGTIHSTGVVSEPPPPPPPSPTSTTTGSMTATVILTLVGLLR
jgi:hypothetical protein